MSMKSCSRTVMLTGVAAALGAVLAGHTPALAASDNDPRTYAGDYQGGSLPIGTAIISQYFSYAHADAFVDPKATSPPRPEPNASATIASTDDVRCRHRALST